MTVQVDGGDDEKDYEDWSLRRRAGAHLLEPRRESDLSDSASWTVSSEGTIKTDMDDGGAGEVTMPSQHSSGPGGST
jgi:hypothetical protein